MKVSSSPAETPLWLTMIGSSLTLDNVKNSIFLYLVQYYTIKLFQHLRARGIRSTLYATYSQIVNKLFTLLLRFPAVAKKVNSQLDDATLDLQKKLAPNYEHLPPKFQLNSIGLTGLEVTTAMEQYSNLPSTDWQGGKVSGAVYHGGEEMSKIWTEAFSKFSVSNPLHADIFPGIRKMDAEIVAFTLSIFNSPLPSSILDQEGGAGTTTSGGTESILMACKAYRDRAEKERGITEPEMIIPISAHAAFDKAASYFKIKIHHIPVDPITRKVNLKLVKRAINANTIMLVGSAPNFPDGMIDDIEGLSKLALKYNLGLHVDCCLGSFITPFLERAGFPVEPFDFTVPGVTSISCDTHKYGFAPKGSSIIMYRSKAIRRYQYSVITTWPGGVYASPSMAGSRAGAVIAGTWASMLHLGMDGYTASCLSIVTATKAICKAIQTDFPELYILGNPLCSVLAFGSINEGKEAGMAIYEVGDKLGEMGWHLNALQNPPALHLACTRLTVGIVDELLRDIRLAIDAVKSNGGKGGGSMVMIYGLGSSSAVGPGLVEEMCTRYMDTLYL